MKILYAAGRYSSSAIQLQRIQETLKNYEVKTAGFSFMGLPVNFTLDPLLSLYWKNSVLRNNMFAIYRDEVKRFNPDLIISDLEMYTSSIAKLLQKPLWHYSSALLRQCVKFSDVNESGIASHYRSYLKRYENVVEVEDALVKMTNMNLIPSHFGDAGIALKPRKGFYWSRPYHKLANDLPTKKFTYVGATEKSNKPMVHFLKQQENVLLLSPTEEKYPLTIKAPSELDGNYIKDSNVFVCDGNPYHAADGFYNGKYTIFYVNLKHSDKEELFTAALSRKHFLGSVYHRPEKIEPDIHWNKKAFSTSLNPTISYLHEEVETWNKRYGQR